MTSISLSIQDLQRMASNLPEEKRYVAMLHDEMSIWSDLVFDHRRGKLIGFVNPESWNIRKVIEATFTATTSPSPHTFPSLALLYLLLYSPPIVVVLTVMLK